jgi:hypothetical protein
LAVNSRRCQRLENKDGQLSHLVETEIEGPGSGIDVLKIMRRSVDSEASV